MKRALWLGCLLMMLALCAGGLAEETLPLRYGSTGDAVIMLQERLTELGGVRILMMHGHTRRVKSGPMAAIYAARECGADILLFGHTHQPVVDRSGDFWVMNPGCIGPSVRRTYGVITLEDGKVDCAAFRL